MDCCYDLSNVIFYNQEPLYKEIKMAFVEEIPWGSQRAYFVALVGSKDQRAAKELKCSRSNRRIFLPGKQDEAYKLKGEINRLSNSYT